MQTQEQNPRIIKVIATTLGKISLMRATRDPFYKIQYWKSLKTNKTSRQVIAAIYPAAKGAKYFIIHTPEMETFAKAYNKKQLSSFYEPDFIEEFTTMEINLDLINTALKEIRERENA